MTSALSKLLLGDVANGIYRLDMSMRPETICQRVSQAGFTCCYLDGSLINDKESLLSGVADAMSFPDYFGDNWDALEECVTDLNWMEGDGCVLLFDHASSLVAHHPEVWNTFYDILESAVAYWSERTRPFYVVLRNTGRIPQATETL